VTAGEPLLEESAEDLFENAPCGYISTRLDGTIVRVNRAFEQLSGFGRGDLLGTRRFQDLLTAGGRIYHETHYAPLLRMQGSVREIAMELVRPGGERVPVLVASVVRSDETGRQRVVRTSVFDATDRRRYEQELLRSREREKEVALELQRSLLSGELPRDPGLELEVRYEPAEATLEVGGDWYDAFFLGEGRTVGLVMGDVVGRGIGAAATMGQLRSAVRALAATGLAPGPLLDALDAFAARHGVGTMATLAYAEVDLDAAAVRLACAGHPPPALIAPGGEPRYWWAGRSVPLDAHARGPDRAQAEIALEPGTVILLFTDGLIERPEQPINTGLSSLLAQAAARRDDPLGSMADGILRAMVADRPGQDDVCLLAARVGRSG
jgi:sigma-B regulation protein RsbU (phosphoserine phosphatase)